MLTMSSTLTEACISPRRHPYVRAIIRDRVRRWSIYHKHPVQVTQRKLAATKGIVDQSRIVRARNYAGTIQINRITDPSDPNQWYTWNNVGSTTLTGSDVTIFTTSTNNRMYLMYWTQSGATYYITYYHSTDDGSTWTGPLNLVSTTSPPPNFSLAGCYPGVLVWLQDTANQYVCWKQYTGPYPASWGTTFQSPAGHIPWNTDFGVAVAKDPEGADRYVIAVCFSDTTPNYWTYVTHYTPSTNTWATTPHDIYPIGTADPHLRPRWPFLLAAHDQNLYLTLCEYVTDGTNIHVSYTVWQDVGKWGRGNHAMWGKPSLLNVYSDVYDARVPLVEHTVNGRYTMYAAAEYTILKSLEYLETDPNQYMECPDIIRIRTETGNENDYGYIDLANPAGIYAGAGQDGQLGAPIRPGAQVQLRLGYVTANGAEYCDTAPWEIETVEHVFQHGDFAENDVRPAEYISSSYLRIHLIGLWKKLEGWNAPLDYSYSNRTGLYVLRSVLARAAGVQMYYDGAAALGRYCNNYEIKRGPRPGEAWRWRREWIPPDELTPPILIWKSEAGTQGKESVWRILHLFGVAMRTDNEGNAYCIDIKNQTASGPADWTAGSRGEILSARYGTSSSGPHRARVKYGSGNYCREYEYPALSQAEGSLIDTQEDRDELYAHDTALEIAQGLAHDGASKRYSGAITIPAVPGLELWDIIDIIDWRMSWGEGDARRRVCSITLEYQPHRGRYHMLVGLQATTQPV